MNTAQLPLGTNRQQDWRSDGAQAAPGPDAHLLDSVSQNTFESLGQEVPQPLRTTSTATAIDMNECDPQRFSGAWVFRGTRIPVAALFENLEDGVSLAEFVELLPGVTEQQARLVLEHGARSTAAAVA
jgi:uncharacterized protein (DUF433 family)